MPPSPARSRSSSFDRKASLAIDSDASGDTLAVALYPIPRYPSALGGESNNPLGEEELTAGKSVSWRGHARAQAGRRIRAERRAGSGLWACSPPRGG